MESIFIVESVVKSSNESLKLPASSNSPSLEAIVSSSVVLNQRSRTVPFVPSAVV